MSLKRQSSIPHSRNVQGLMASGTAARRADDAVPAHVDTLPVSLSRTGDLAPAAAGRAETAVRTTEARLIRGPVRTGYNRIGAGAGSGIVESPCKSE